MFVATIAAWSASQAAGTAVSYFVAPFFNSQNALQTSSLYGEQCTSWNNRPLLIPPAATLLELYSRGILRESIVRPFLRQQGVHWRDESERGTTPAGMNPTQADNRVRMWEGVRRGLLQQPGIDFVMGLWSRGYWAADSQTAKDLIQRAGGDPLVWKDYRTAMFASPDPSMLLDMRDRGIVGNDYVSAKLIRLGYGHAADRVNMMNMRKVPDAGTILVAINRGKYTVAEGAERLKQLGYGEFDDRAAILDQRYQVPGPSDLVHFAVKEAFSVDIANRLGLYDEFPAVIMPYMEQQGLGYQVGFNIRSDGVDRPAGIPDLYWAAHWQPISASQSFDMLHRFRPNRLARYQAMGLNVTAFGMQDVRDWLRINDYPPAVRENIAGLSFNPLRLVDIRQAVGYRIRAGVDAAFALQIGPQGIQALQRFDRDWAIEQFLDRGSVREDAEVQADLAIAAEANRAAAPARALERSTLKSQFTAILKGYALGILAEEVARNALTGLGMSAAAAARQLELQRAAILMGNAASVLKSCRKEYLTGGMSASDAVELLLRAGFQNERIEDYIDQWVIERDTVRKAASTAQIENWLAKGYITPLNARERFSRLGWQEPEIVALFAEANQRALDIQARLLSAGDRNRRRRIADLEKLRKQAEKNVKDVQKAIKAATPISTLQRWLKKAIISHDEFVVRMMRAGYSRANAERYATDALRPNPPQPTAPKPPAATSAANAAQQPTASTAAHGPTPQAIESLRLSLAAAEGSRPLVLNTQPQRLNVQPEQLHTLPERLGGDNPQGGG